MITNLDHQITAKERRDTNRKGIIKPLTISRQGEASWCACSSAQGDGPYSQRE
jgi:hypothetical protein